MKRLIALLGFLLILLSPPPAYADSLVGSSKECGTYTWDGSLTKGRTDAMVAYYDHTEGCFRYKGFTVIGADREEMAGNPQRERAWQMSECEKAGRDAVVGHFRYYRGIEIDPSSFKVSCKPHQGSD